MVTSQQGPAFTHEAIIYSVNLIRRQRINQIRLNNSMENNVHSEILIPISDPVVQLLIDR